VRRQPAQRLRPRIVGHVRPALAVDPARFRQPQIALGRQPLGHRIRAPRHVDLTRGHAEDNRHGRGDRKRCDRARYPTCGKENGPGPAHLASL
jgi:hypothetical protein